MQLTKQNPQIPQTSQLEKLLTASTELRLADDTNMDMRRYGHPMVPPVRRGPFNYYYPPKEQINIHTRGYPQPYHQIGYLYTSETGETEGKALPLMGRRLHTNQFEYYTFHHSNTNIKVPLPIKKEINDGDSIDVPGYQDSYVAKVYDNDMPRYL
jgi:hypothetical protein